MAKYFSGMASAVTVLTALQCTSANVHAQQSKNEAEDNRSLSVALEEIIVTAQRRSETMEKTPVSISVLGSDALEQQAIVSELDLQTALPGLTVKAGQSANQLNFSIRGQTVDSFSSSRPSVLPYFNEIQVGGSASTAFYDLASVQVLKGPQGTLFGRNSTGGAVLFSTAKPSNTLEGYASIWGGNYDEVKAEGAVNIPIVEDKVLLRLSGFYQSRDGYQYNIFNQSRLGDVQRENARVSLTVNPTTAISNELVIDYAKSEGNNITSVAYNAFEIGTGNPFVPANFLYSPLVDTAFGDGAWDAFLAAHPGADPEGWVASVEKQQQRGPFRVNVDAPNFHSAENLLVSNITTFDLGNDMQIKNIIGYTHMKSSNASEFDGTPFPSDDNGDKGRGGTLEQFSEEIQLLGEAFDGQLSYVTGLYYSDEKDHTRSLSVLFDLTPAAPPVNQINDGVTSNETYAGYAQGTLDLDNIVGVEGLAFTLGGRYSSEEVTFYRRSEDVFIASPAPAGAVFVNPLTDTFDQFSWTIGLQQQLNDELLLYANSRRSFRSGGFNYFAPPLEGFGNDGGGEYQEETATDLEIGAKFKGELGGVPVRMNVAVYQMWIDEIQRSNYVQIFGTLAGITVNVPEAEISGLEIDAEFRPASWLSVGGAVNYTDASFTDNEVSVLGNPVVEFGPYPDTPEWSASLFADISFAINDRLDGSLRADFYHQTSMYFSSTHDTLNPGTEIPGYSVTNVRLAVEDAESGWSVAGYVKNAFDETYYVGGIGFASLFAVNTVIPGAPRTYMLEARYKF
jgi:iron complex outermembrane receptor protein